MQMGGFGGMPNGEQKKGFNQHLYKTALCKTFTQNGSCTYNDKCKFAHGAQDLHEPGSTGGGNMGPGFGGYGGFQNQQFGGMGYNNGMGQGFGGYGGPQGFNPGFNQGFNENFQKGPAGGVQQVCKFFSQSGNCKWGNGCKFSHQVS